MNLQSFFQDFNPSKFLVHSCLFVFVILICLKFDGYADWPYWTIFMPLWFWKCVTILGATVGAIVWCKFPHYRLEGDSYAHFKAMLISLSLHLILLMFELLVCDRLTSGRHLWVLVFIPLIFGSVASVGACVWAVKHERSFELELFCAVNALQFVFIPLKLDGFVSWSWEVVFVPLWIVLCLSLVMVLYSIIFCSILLRTPDIPVQQKRTAINSAFGNCATVLPILVFQILLADKLDGDLHWPYIAIAAPLLFGLLILILLSFNAKGGNKWWFGMRKTFYQYLLSTLPCLQEYGNISYHTEPNNDTENGPANMALESNLNGGAVDDKNNKKIIYRKIDYSKPVVPIVNIDMPD